MPIQFDVSRHPVVQVRFSGALEDAEMLRYLEDMDRVLQRREMYGAIFDARDVTSVSPKQRRIQADWLEKNESLLRDYAAGYAFVITSQLIRGVLTAILWLKPMPSEHVVVATVEEAERWLGVRIRARGLSMRSPPLR